MSSLHCGCIVGIEPQVKALMVCSQILEFKQNTMYVVILEVAEFGDIFNHLFELNIFD